ncbi:hypothetical protein N431DRAFT_439717 [Stipitochalara longipes BDJ]|nr:hypothetical protein N431DRAFT_439717 [Stipitochalara longipes BDJ]
MTDPEPGQSSGFRLYLALYIRDGVTAGSQGPDRYHWAFLAIPGSDNSHPEIATRFHARDYYINPDETHWIYEEIHVSAHGTPKLLSQTYIGDVADDERLFEILRDAPIKQENGWNCVSWIKSAMDSIWEEDGLLEGVGDNGWEALKSRALIEADSEAVRREEKRLRALL